MARISLVYITVLLIVLALSSVSCRKGVQCSNSIHCKTRYCRDGKCIKFGDDPNDVGRNPCSRVRCGFETICFLEQVQCVQFPCPPAPRCLKCSGVSCPRN